MVKPHAVVVPYPAQGHVLPMLELSHRLADHGIRVTFVNTDFIHDRVMKSISDSASESGPDVRREVRMVSIPDGVERPEDREDLGKLTEGIFRAMPGGLESVIERSARVGEPVSCVIADGQFGWAFDVAAKFGIKKVGFGLASAAARVSLLSIPRLISDGIIDGEDGTILKRQMVQLGPGTPPLHSTNFIWASVGDRPTQKIIYDMLRKIPDSEKNADRLYCNSSYNLEPGTFSEHPDATPIGPLLASNRLAKSSGHFWPEDRACMTWLDRHPADSVVYVAFGSFAVLDPKQFRELALGLELTGRPFLWVVRQDVMTHIEEEGFRKRVEERGNMVVRWAPQQEVLSHRAVGCFVSHCGWNSTVEGIVCGGVPFVCWPYFADQFLNESYICDEWKIGLRLRKDESGIVGCGEIKEKLERVLGDDEGFKERALDLQRKTLDSVERGNSRENFNDFIEWIKEG
ncbi:UDP-glycosyltransferase 83A1 [Striga hermonthica]|uniref:UDP-glycosyltransferase 83A1 n=1 Tax=Striga hermonthica TaxID=68872 RepID=A0A9N7NGF5_STRHE|nr:UDP-glycosyltransferase 83A1 [Striga hermonthica]